MAVFVYYTIHIFIMHVTVMWVHKTVRADHRRDTKSRRVLDLVYSPTLYVSNVRPKGTEEGQQNLHFNTSHPAPRHA